jgi:hypothetical protein
MARPNKLIRFVTGFLVKLRIIDLKRYFMVDFYFLIFFY